MKNLKRIMLVLMMSVLLISCQKEEIKVEEPSTSTNIGTLMVETTNDITYWNFMIFDNNGFSYTKNQLNTNDVLLIQLEPNTYTYHYHQYQLLEDSSIVDYVVVKPITIIGGETFYLRM